MKIDKKGIVRIHALLAKIGMANDKEYKLDLVKQYTGGRETSTTGLHVDEAGRLISDLQKMVGLAPNDIKADQKRKLILHLAHEMMWELPQRNGERPRVDMVRVDNFCVDRGYLHKPLMDYTLGELSKLVWQMQQVHKDFLKAV
jgi:hypothetical protein